MKKLSKSIQRVIPKWLCFGILKFQDDPPYPIEYLSRPDPENTRDNASIQQSQSIWHSEESPSNQENKNYKNLSERKSHKNKSKRKLAQSQCPVKTPKKQTSPSRHDATEAKKVMVQSFATEETRRFDSWLCTIVSYRGNKPRAGKEERVPRQSVPRTNPCLPPRKKEDQPELFSDL